MLKERYLKIIGNKYGRWKVTDDWYKKNSHVYFMCECECGTKKYVQATSIGRKDGSLSCGCLRVEVSSIKTTDKPLMHYRVYHIYKNMLNRCYNTKANNFNRYGKKGIKVTKEWRHDFWVFEKWALENGYSDELTLDRIDNSKGYEPANCRWISYEEQSYNKTNNVYIEYNGQRKNFLEWSLETGLPMTTLRNRYYKGLSPKDILTKPYNKPVKRNTNIGELIKNYREENELSQKEMADLLNVHESTLYRWENKRAEPDKKFHKNIMEVLELEIDKEYKIKR